MTFPDVTQHASARSERNFYVQLRRPWFWLILLLFAVITFFHYGDHIQGTSAFALWLRSGTTIEYTLNRALYLLPIVLSGFLFGWQGSLFMSFLALIAMLPRVIFLSEQPVDAALETSTVFVIGSLLSMAFITLRKERDYRKELESAQEELKSSEQRYRQLFEDAGDSIVVHALDGTIIAINHATEELLGYTKEEIMNNKAGDFLIGEDSKAIAMRTKNALLKGESVEPYEQHVTRKDGTEVDMQISTSLVYEKGKPVAFQHIGRNITEKKRLDENLRFYVRQATRAQEEERKRISMELHDDTIQALIVLSRQLDSLTMVREGISDEVRNRLEALWQQTDNILQGLRRLSQDLRPAMIDRLGLIPSIEWLAENLKKYANIETSVEFIGKEHRLPEEVAVALFRVTQEALSNVRKHSRATEAEVIVEFEENLARVTVKDNGKGFDMPGKTGDLAKYGKLGLAGMQERAELVGGKLTVTSQPGKGTTLTVEAPG